MSGILYLLEITYCININSSEHCDGHIDQTLEGCTVIIFSNMNISIQQLREVLSEIIFERSTLALKYFQVSRNTSMPGFEKSRDTDLEELRLLKFQFFSTWKLPLMSPCIQHTIYYLKTSTGYFKVWMKKPKSKPRYEILKIRPWQLFCLPCTLQ